MRLHFGLIMLLAGCAAGPRTTQLIVEPPGEHPVTVELVNPGPVQVEDISLNDEDGEWILAGRLRYRGRSMVSRTDRTFQITAADARGGAVFSTFAIAKLLPATSRYKASRRGSFRAPVPAPDTFDRITIVLGPPDPAP